MHHILRSPLHTQRYMYGSSSLVGRVQPAPQPRRGSVDTAVVTRWLTVARPHLQFDRRRCGPRCGEATPNFRTPARSPSAQFEPLECFPHSLAALARSTNDVARVPGVSGDVTFMRARVPAARMWAPLECQSVSGLRGGTLTSTAVVATVHADNEACRDDDGVEIKAPRTFHCRCHGSACTMNASRQQGRRRRHVRMSQRASRRRPRPFSLITPAASSCHRCTSRKSAFGCLLRDRSWGAPSSPATLLGTCPAKPETAAIPLIDQGPSTKASSAIRTPAPSDRKPRYKTACPSQAPLGLLDQHLASARPQAVSPHVRSLSWS